MCHISILRPRNEQNEVYGAFGRTLGPRAGSHMPRHICVEKPPYIWRLSRWCCQFQRKSSLFFRNTMGTRVRSTRVRSTTGCWTCRLRRKKCDEEKPSCQRCNKLQLKCDGYGERPPWMVENRRNCEQIRWKRQGSIKLTTLYRKHNSSWNPPCCTRVLLPIHLTSLVQIAPHSRPKPHVIQ